MGMVYCLFSPSLLLFSAKSDQEFANRLKSGEKYLSVSKYHSIPFVGIKSEALLPAYYVGDKVKTKFETFLIVEETNAGKGSKNVKKTLGTLYFNRPMPTHRVYLEKSRMRSPVNLFVNWRLV